MYKKDTPLDLEEAKIHKTAWIVYKEIREARLREVANVTVIGFRRKDGTFLPMPKPDTLVTPESKLLLVGTSEGISKAKKILRKKVRPAELSYV